MHCNIFRPISLPNPLCSGYYVIGIPFGIWLAFKLDMGLEGLWIGLTVALVYCAGCGVFLCLRTDWDEEVRKVIARVEAEQTDQNGPAFDLES